MDPHLPKDYVPPDGTRRKGVSTRSSSTTQARNDPPPPPRRAPSAHADVDPKDDPLTFPAASASAAGPTPTAEAEDDGRTAAYEAALAQAEQALNDEQTTVAELTRRLQQQQDLLVEMQKSAQGSRSASGSMKKPRPTKKGQPKDRKQPTPEPVKEQHDTAELLAGLQALLQVYGERPAQGTPERGRRTRKGPRHTRRDDAPSKSRSSTATDRSTSSDRSSSSSSTSGPPTPPSPPSSPSESSDESTTDEEEATRRRRGLKSKRSKKNEHEVFDRRMAIHAPNRRYRRLLCYKTYFLEDTRLAYPPRLVRKAHKLNKCLDGPFQGQAPFTGKDPLAIFGFLSTFKKACDAAGASHGQALPLLGFRLSGSAKLSFTSAVSNSGTRDAHAIKTYGDGVNWLLQKFATPDKLNEAYTEVISARQEQEEAPRAFGERLERMCDRLVGLFNSSDLVDTFINGLHDAIKAQVVMFQMTKGRVSLPEAITTAQIYWTGVQKVKVDLRRHIRNTTSPIRVGAVSEAVVANVAVTPPQPPRFARTERNATPASRSPSPRRTATSTDECYNCHRFGHFSSDCPEPRRERRRSSTDRAVTAFVDTDDHPAHAQGN